MFTKNDFDTIDTGYFHLLLKTGYHIKLKSRNTGHIWTIYSKDLTHNRRSIEIWHQHRESNRPHLQNGYHPKTVKEAQKMIRDHDRYVLERKSDGLV